MKSIGRMQQYAFDNLDVDTGAGRNVLAGVGEANSDALSEGGGGESQDCDSVFHDGESAGGDQEFQ